MTCLCCYTNYALKVRVMTSEVVQHAAGQLIDMSLCSLPQRLHKESDRLSKEAPQYAQQLTLVNADLAKLVEHSAQERCGTQSRPVLQGSPVAVAAAAELE